LALLFERPCTIQNSTKLGAKKYRLFYKSDLAKSPIKGILHCSALEPFTKYEMSCHIADVLGLAKDHLKSDKSAAEHSGGPLLRPMNPQLCTEYSFGLIQFQPVMKFKDCIKDCLENFV